MLILPLQWGWASAAAYCAHEAGSAAQHLGHHQHRHQHERVADAGSADKPADGTVPAGADADCGHCHGHTMAALPDAQPLLSSASAGTAAAPRVAEILAAALSRPERPQWAGLA